MRTLAVLNVPSERRSAYSLRLAQYARRASTPAVACVFVSVCSAPTVVAVMSRLVGRLTDRLTAKLLGLGP